MALKATIYRARIELSHVETLKRALRGIGHPFLLRAMNFSVKRMKVLKELYASYPSEPEGLPAWEQELERAYAPVWRRFGKAFDNRMR